MYKLRQHARNRMIKRYGNVLIPRLMFLFARKRGILQNGKQKYQIGKFKYLVTDGLIQTFMYGSGAMERKREKKLLCRKNRLNKPRNTCYKFNFITLFQS